MERRNNFDALRLLAAVTVIFSHSFLIAQGVEQGDPLNIITGNQCMIGLAAVFVFFAVSGFLITQSYEQTRSPLRYLVKRALRIFPGLIVVLLLTAFVLGPVVTSLPLSDYLHRPEPYRYVLHNAIFNVDMHTLPGVVFVDNAIGLEVNGALWTLGPEFQMYLMVMVLGVFRLLRLPVCLALLALGMACIHFDELDALGSWGWLLGFFAMGMTLYKLRGTRIFDGRIALLAVVVLVASVPLRQFILLFPLFGCYLALYLALHPRLPIIPAARYGDLSYGLYIYGWPAEQLSIWLMRGHAQWWQVFLLATLIAGTLAFLSWHLIEKRALALKPGAGAWQGWRDGIWRKAWPRKSPTVAISPSNTASRNG